MQESFKNSFSYNQKDLQLEYTTTYWRAFGQKKEKKKEDWQQMLAQVLIFKKKKIICIPMHVTANYLKIKLGKQFHLQ